MRIADSSDLRSAGFSKGTTELRRGGKAQQCRLLLEVGGAVAPLRGVARQHGDASSPPFGESERPLPARLLARIAAEQGFTPGVRPYSRRIDSDR